MGDSHPSTRISVHQALGGGSVADLLLWRKRWGAACLLGSATVFWIIFEKTGYNLLSFAANVQLLLVVTLFFWAKSASLLNRPLPPLPNLEISEASASKAADALQIWVNGALSIAHDIAVGQNLRRLIQVCFVLWIVSFVGSFFNFLTLVYLGAILSLSVPVLYEKYQDHINDKLYVTHRVIQTQYSKIDERLLKKIAGPTNKEKKIQ